MDDRRVRGIRRAMGVGLAAICAVAVVVLLVSIRSGDASKAQRLHSVRSVSLPGTSCAQWPELSDDVRWISAYRELSTRRYDAAARNRQPAESEVDAFEERIGELCAAPAPPELGRTVEDAANQAIFEDPSLLAD
jgi:hypothetical protein